MVRKPKSIEEKITEAQEQKRQLALRLQELERNRKARDARERAKAEKLLLKAIMQRYALTAGLKDAVERAVAESDLSTAERATVETLFTALATPPANALGQTQPAEAMPTLANASNDEALPVGDGAAA